MNITHESKVTLTMTLREFRVLCNCVGNVTEQIAPGCGAVYRDLKKFEDTLEEGGV